MRFEATAFSLCRWLIGEESKSLEDFVRAHFGAIARDLDGDYVYLAQNQFSLNYEIDRAPKIKFLDIKDYQIRRE